MTDTAVERVVIDPRFERLVPPDAVVRRLADGTMWAEGPVYVPDEDALVWSDIPNDRVLRWSGTDGSVRELYRPADFANGHTLDHDGTILACEHGTRRVARYERDGSADDRRRPLRGQAAQLAERHHRRVRRRDLVHRPALRHRQRLARDTPPSRSWARATSSGSIATTGELAIVSDEMVDPNGLAFSPDESVLYVSDTSRARLEGGNHHILAFDVIDGGRRLGAPRVFAVIEPGRADGFRVDVEGNVWTSAGDGIHVLDSGGHRARADPDARAGRQLHVRRRRRRRLFIDGDIDAVVDRRRDPRGGHAVGGPRRVTAV